MSEVDEQAISKVDEQAISKVDKQRVNEIWRYMLEQKRAVTKQELCALIGWEYNSNNERKIRELIRILKLKRPVCATSDNTGYELLYNVHDPAQIEKARHQLRETLKRSREILQSNITIEAFLRLADSKKL